MNKNTIINVLNILITLIILTQQSIYAQSTQFQNLEINCPSQVNESFYFLISVISNDTYIENATVNFNNKTNITNSKGFVGFYAPRYNSDENNTYKITASKEGYKTTIFKILVLDYPQVFPTVSFSNIPEQSKFIVTIIDDAKRVVNDAKLIFNGKEYISSGTGIVKLAAPSVNKSKTFNITVSKQNYISSTISVTIYPLIFSEDIFYYGFILIFFVIIFLVIIYKILINIK